jgi:hypothetical protein
MKMGGAVIVGIILIELCVGLGIKIDNINLHRTDFVNFYGAATIIHAGNAATLYSRTTQDNALRTIQQGNNWQYFLHPPFEAYALTPLARMHFENAYRLWLLFNVGLLAVYPVIVIGSIKIVSSKPYLGWLGFLFLPVLTALVLGQDSILLLLVLTFSYSKFLRNKNFSAGLILSLAAIKFQYLALLSALVISSRRFRLFSGILAGSILLIIISALVVGPRGLVHYAQFVHDFDIHSGYGTLNPKVMVNLRGFLAGIAGNVDLRTGYLAGDITLIILGMVFLRSVQQPEDTRLIFAFYIALSVVASPYANFPDMTILILPALLAIDWIASKHMREIREKFLIFSTVTLFCLPPILLAFSGPYWWESRVYLNFISIFLFLLALGWNIWATSSPQPVFASRPFAAQLPRDHS